MASTFDVVKFVSKLLPVVEGISKIVHRVKDAPKADKVEAILNSVPESIALAEFAAGKDLLNDAEVAKLLAALVEAEHAVADARDALKNAIVAKAK
jgi:hypothetical protein